MLGSTNFCRERKREEHKRDNESIEGENVENKEQGWGH